MYSVVTETPGKGATAEELVMLYTRYHLAAEMAQGKDVLEVACGPGMGLGLMARRANRLVGGDYDPLLLQMGRGHYGERVPLIRLDAHALPFGRASFDLVILFEAVYYLRRAEIFLEEVRRVLRTRGVILLCSSNKERPGFLPSPFSTAYYSAAELRGLLTRHGFTVELHAAFPVRPVLRRNSRSAARWLANGIRLSPDARALAKRILFGETLSFPVEVGEGMAEAAALTPLCDDAGVSQFQVLYAIGRLQ